MQAISRRSLLGGVALLATASSLAAATAEQLTVDAGEGRVTVSRFASERSGKRPAVLVRHGSRGFDLRPQVYQRYAKALTADGIDAYFVRYYTPADEQAFRTLNTREAREAYETGRFRGLGPAGLGGAIGGAVGRGQFRPDRTARLFAWRLRCRGRGGS
ncbi:hypothetical protein ACVW1C_003768 [Bradyrhizobium sp. USDA 4011]